MYRGKPTLLAARNAVTYREMRSLVKHQREGYMRKEVSSAAIIEAAFQVYPWLNECGKKSSVRKLVPRTIDMSVMTRMLPKSISGSVHFFTKEGEQLPFVPYHAPDGMTIQGIVESIQRKKETTVHYIVATLKEDNREGYTLYLGMPDRDKTIAETLEAEMNNAIKIVRGEQPDDEPDDE